MKTHVENRLLFPVIALNKAFTTNVSFLRVFAFWVMKTDQLYAE